MRDYMLKQHLRALDRHETFAAAICECGHENRGHRELPHTLYALNEDESAIVEMPNPEYAPLMAHCNVEGCDCVQNWNEELS